MIQATQAKRSEFPHTPAIEPEVLDALVIGAGVAGLYQIHQLRKQGLNVLGVDTATDVGGTWYWNRYPGAKFDSEAYIYQYLFDEDLYKDWTWSQRFPAQPEIERWMHYITDRLELRPNLRFSTTVTSAAYDPERGRWLITTDTGATFDAQFLIGCGGMLSAPLENRFPGQETFNGRIFHTARWPREPLDLTGKRVGVIGCGATGIQVIQSIASQAEELKVFVRTPQYTLPMKTPCYGPEDEKGYKARFNELRDTLPHTFSGFEYDVEHSFYDLSKEQRRELLEELHADGSLKLWLASFAEIFVDEQASREVSEFVREKMCERLKDPKLIETLVPTPDDYGFGTHRVPLEDGYLEVYHRDNVEAVCVRNNEIEEIVPEGVKLADGTIYELDVIILAVGFDAGTGALTRVDIHGRDGRTLKDDWARDIRTTYGMLVEGYPNMMVTGAPLAPSAALCNMATCLQQQTEWIADLIKYMRTHDKSVAEPSAELEEHWVQHHDEIANMTLVAKTASWYTGANVNVDGKPGRLLSYIGGVGQYRQECDKLTAAGYEGVQMA